MFIFSGNLGNYAYAQNETITVVFPTDIELGDPVSAYWQWSKEPTLKEKASVTCSGNISSVTKTFSEDGFQVSPSTTLIHFSLGPYDFKGILSKDLKELTLTMEYSSSTSICGPVKVVLAASNTKKNVTGSESLIVYTGQIKWLEDVSAETLTLVTPCGVTKGASFGVYGRWSLSEHQRNSTTANMHIDGIFQTIVQGTNGTLTATYMDGTYTYTFTFCDAKHASVEFSIHNRRRGNSSCPTKLTAVYSGSKAVTDNRVDADDQFHEARSDLGLEGQI
ncbi:hypothetical protein GSI_01377 [Ganoderma sinense ZZ0214-1]|uniref:Uncharacterized protein n=1 Tax=Ganoderma sinense ZZ0214-1 TaxID=1077348 RepID=A0A2G8SVD5_9APHY|nr:hypothetical protein GSI_01377 [Ganoderma sinense ZZ0214-1]